MASWQELQQQRRDAFAELVRSYGGTAVRQPDGTYRKRGNVPYAASQALAAEWDPKVEEARKQYLREKELQKNPNLRYSGAGPEFASYVNAYPDLQISYLAEKDNFPSQAAFGKFHWENYGQAENRSLTGPEDPVVKLTETLSNQTSVLQKGLEDQLAALEKQLSEQQTSAAEQLEAYKTTAAEEQELLREQLEAYKLTSAEEQETLQEAFAKQLEAYETSAAEERALLEEQYGEQLESYKTTSAEERKTLEEGFAEQLKAYKTTSAEERKTLEEGFTSQLEAYQTAAREQQEALQSEFALQNRLKQEEARRQMLIGLQSKSRGPAPVRTAASRAQQQGLTTRGSTGYFGRQGLRIGSLNVPTSGMTISSGQQPTKVTTPGSFN